MKTFVLELMDKDTFKEIMSYLDDIETSKEEGQIYVNSGGGSIWTLFCIRTRLEELKEKGLKITLRGIFLCSASFDLFYHYTGNKVIERDCDGIVHTVATELHSFNKGGEIRLRSDDKIERIRFKESENTFIYDFLTIKEQKEFDDGEDIYLNYKRLQSIFNK